MTCVKLEELASEYLEGRLEAAEQSRVEGHLSACAACRKLLEDVRAALRECQAAEEMLAPPWLVPGIRRATLGEKSPGLLERLTAYPKLFRQPRLVYGIAMTVFSLSLIANVSGFRLRNMSLEDLNPARWYHQVNRAGHLFYAHAEKFYYDLRIIYEIESRFRNTETKRSGQQGQSNKSATAPGAPGGQPMELSFESFQGPQAGIFETPRSTVP